MFISLLLANSLVIIIFPLMLLFTDIASMANRFATNTIIFSILGAALVMQMFYSIFYEDSLTSNLVSLPVSDKEVFYSRILTLLFYNFAFIFGFIAQQIISHIMFSGFNLLSIILILCYSLAFIILVYTLAILLLMSISKIKIFQKHKKILNSVIATVGVITSFAFTSSIISSTSTSTELVKASDYKGDFLFNIVAHTLEISSLISIFGITVIAGFSILLLNKLVKNYTTTFTSQSETAKQRVKEDKNTDYSANTIFRKMTLKSLLNSSIIIQNIAAPIFLPMMLIGGFLGLRELGYFTNGGISVLPTALAFAIVFTFLMISNASFSALAISIDYKNYESLKTMPLNIKNYILNKLYWALTLQLPIITIIFLGILLILDAGLLVIIISLVLFIITSLSYSIHFFIRDIKKPFIGWANTTQLVNRGKVSGVATFIKFILLIIFASATIGANIFYTKSFPNYWYIPTFIYFVIAIILAFVVVRKLLKKIKYI
ncbi:MAG: hypothetical protein Q3988_02375 [Gemella sp.]|nr:hypothetical protein [Gemella sp.]